jgi:hypothetical protein
MQMVEQQPLQQIEFKEVQIKPIELNLSQLRSGKSLTVKTAS